MSKENVEVVQSLYEGWLRGEIGLDKLDPEISWTLRERKILRMVGYADRAQALEAVGLAE